ncbi:MAG: hypothetical protein ABI183_07775, partial [Polyangiaceae bacterium]
LREPADAEPLKYRKYPLPEEISEQTSPTRRIPSLLPTAASNSSSPPSAAAGNSGAPSAGSPGWQEQSAGGSNAQQFDFDEPIDIPGTHVPTWTVVLLILGVISALSATAFLFLR